MPVAFLLGVAAFELGALVFHKPEWRVVSFWLLVAAVIMAIPALITGWITGNELKFTGTSAAPPLIFIKHRIAAFTTTGFALTLLLWRVRMRDEFPRKAQLAVAALALMVTGVVGYTGYLGGRMVFGDVNQEASQSSDYVAVKSGTETKTPVVKPELVAAGQKLFAELPCQSCHRMNGKGGKAGPELTHEAQRHADVDWHIRHLNDPAKVKPGSDMPPFDYLSPRDLKALAAYLSTRK
jgi:uncharacterized membrane protein